MTPTLSQVAEEYEKSFPEASILLKMSLQAAVQSLETTKESSRVHELEQEVAVLRGKLSRPHNGGSKKAGNYNYAATAAGRPRNGSAGGRVKL